MSIDLTPMNVITILGMFVMATWALVKVIGRQQETRLTLQESRLGEKLDGITAAIGVLTSGMAKQGDELRNLERELLQLKGELPMQYVRREDYIQGQSRLEAKIDGLASKVENAQLRGIINGGKYGS